MTTAPMITDLNQDLEHEHRYMLYFDLPPITDIDILRKISNGTNLVATYLNYAGKLADVELLGTTVAENVDGIVGKRQFLALIRVHGTPLLAAVGPVVAIILIAAGVYLVITFRHAIDVTLTNVGGVVKDVGAAVGTLADGINQLTQDTGTGIKYALPIVGVGLSVLLVIYLTSMKGFRRG